MMCHTYKHGKEQEGQRWLGWRSNSGEPANRRSRNRDRHESGEETVDVAVGTPASNSRPPRPGSMRPVFLQPRYRVVLTRFVLLALVGMASWALGAVMYVMASVAIARKDN